MYYSFSKYYHPSAWLVMTYKVNTQPSIKSFIQGFKQQEKKGSGTEIWEECNTCKSKFLHSRTRGPSPHAAKIIIPTAEVNLITRGLPCKRLNDLQDTNF